MKKILSLVALLVMTVAAMANVYTGSRVINVSGYDEYTDEGEVNVESNGDGTYNVTFKGIQSVDGQYTDIFGDFLFKNVPGETVNGVTTITKSDVSGSVSGGQYTFPSADGSIVVKYNEDNTKFYANMNVGCKYWGSTFTFNVTVGTDDFGGEGGGDVEPVDEYPINFDKDATITHAERYTSSIKLTVAGGEKQSANTTIRKGYEDLSGTAIFTVPAGSECTPTFDFNGSWMHGYFYIDLNNDKQFSWNADGNDQSGTELVAFSYLGGTNSKGENAEGSVGVNCPSFTAPTTPGTYRIRYKIDWDNADPGGNVNAGNNILNNGGGIWDATLVVEEAETPVEPVTYTGKFYNVRGDEEITLENATISVLDKGEGKYDITIPQFSDMDGGDDETTEGTVGPLTIEVNGTEVDGKTTFSASDLQVTLDENNSNGWKGFVAYISMNGEVVDGQLTATFNVNLAGLEGYDYVLGFNKEPFVATSLEKTDVANITFGGQTVNFDEATIEISEYEEDLVSVTYKNLTLNGNEIGDFCIKNITSSLEDGQTEGTLSTTDTKGVWTRVTENNALGVSAGDEAEIRNFEGTVTVDGGEAEWETAKFVVKFGLNVQNEWADVVFGEKAEEPKEDGGLVEVGYQPNGEAWTKTTTIDWDKQYVKAVIDLSTCQKSFENILSVGASISGWDNAAHYHFYYSPAETSLQFNGMAPDNKSRYDINVDGIVTIEISKRDGLVINGTKYLNTYNSASQYSYDEWVEAMSALWAVTDLEIGGCQGSTFSNATYNYVGVLDLPEEPATVVTEKEYVDKLIVGTSAVSGSTGETYENKTVVLSTWSDDTESITFKEFPLSNGETVDLTFKGSINHATEDGIEYITADELTCTVDDANSSLNGKTISCMVTGMIKTNGQLYLMYEMGTDDYEVYYIGEFGSQTTDAINGIAVDANVAGAQIFTVNGAKVNKMQKGINLVRMANGKVVKVAVK